MSYLKAIIALSGGMDSATVLAEAIKEGRECIGIGFYYGSKHNRFENQKAEELATHYKIPFRLINLKDLFNSFLSNLLQGQKAIPEGHYEDDSMKLTIVPGRNLIFVSILAGLAESMRIEEVWIGIHAGDHTIYPDCRPIFYHAIRDTIIHSSEKKVSLIAPFLQMSKADILREGVALNVPYKLTRTCYKNQKLACGKCGSCVERLEAFTILGMQDPIRYDQ